MPLQFSTELKPEHVREATTGIFLRQISKPIIFAGVAVLFVAVQAILWVLVPALSWQWHTVLAALMAVSVGGAVLFAGLYYQELALRNFRRFKGAPVRASLEDSAYRYEAGWGSGSIEWTRFQSLWCLKGVWVLLQHSEGGVSVLLPAGDLDGEARDFLKARMARVGAKVLD